MFLDHGAGVTVGGPGSVILSGADPITVPTGYSRFVRVHACFDEDLVISAATMCSNVTGSLASKTIPQGQDCLTQFTSITLTSGSGVAHFV